MAKHTHLKKINLFCEEAGIEHRLTAPYTPQENGVSERKNQTIMEKNFNKRIRG